MKAKHKNPAPIANLFDTEQKNQHPNHSAKEAEGDSLPAGETNTDTVAAKRNPHPQPPAPWAPWVAAMVDRIAAILSPAIEDHRPGYTLHTRMPKDDEPRHKYHEDAVKVIAGMLGGTIGPQVYEDTPEDKQELVGAFLANFRGSLEAIEDALSDCARVHVARCSKSKLSTFAEFFVRKDREGYVSFPWLKYLGEDPPSKEAEEMLYFNQWTMGRRYNSITCLGRIVRGEKKPLIYLEDAATYWHDHGELPPANVRCEWRHRHNESGGFLTRPIAHVFHMWHDYNRWHSSEYPTFEDFCAAKGVKDWRKQCAEEPRPKVPAKPLPLPAYAGNWYTDFDSFHADVESTLDRAEGTEGTRKVYLWFVSWWLKHSEAAIKMWHGHRRKAPKEGEVWHCLLTAYTETCEGGWAQYGLAKGKQLEMFMERMQATETWGLPLSPTCKAWNSLLQYGDSAKAQDDRKATIKERWGKVIAKAEYIVKSAHVLGEVCYDDWADWKAGHECGLNDDVCSNDEWHERLKAGEMFPKAPWRIEYNEFKGPERILSAGQVEVDENTDVMEFCRKYL